MFLSNKWNIKEVLLFPAMKPTDEQAEMKKKMSMKTMKKKNGIPQKSAILPFVCSE
jgi:hypothetical protein